MTGPAEPILHVSLVREWAAAQDSGVYEISSLGKTLQQEGFIHCSYPGQVDGVLQRFYSDVREPLCLLVIDPDRLDVPVIAEDLVGAGENFPHVYGSIPVAAVVDVRPIR
jgi:uncharacterized protein (DUF952 family)